MGTLNRIKGRKEKVQVGLEKTYRNGAWCLVKLCSSRRKEVVIEIY